MPSGFRGRHIDEPQSRKRFPVTVAGDNNDGNNDDNNNNACGKIEFRAVGGIRRKRPRHVLGTLIFRSVSSERPGPDRQTRRRKNSVGARNDKSSRCTVINVIDYRRWLAVCHDERYFPVRSSVKNRTASVIYTG